MMASFKFIFLFFFVGMATATKVLPTLKGIMESRNACKVIYPVTEKEIDDFHNNIFPPVPDRLLKCYVRCYVEKLGAMNSEGKFDAERIYDIVYLLFKSKFKMDPMDGIKECIKNRKETVMYERAFAAVKCVGDKKMW